MDIIYDIRRIVKYLYQVFADMTLWCWAHDPPFGFLGDFFLEIYDLLTDLHYGLWQFAQDYESLWEGIVGILTESDIYNLLWTWLTYAEDAWAWVLNSVQNVTDIISGWWSTILPYIIGYVDMAVEGLDWLLSMWDNFWYNTLPNLISLDWLTIWWDSKLLEVDTLIGSWLTAFSPFWEGWQEVRQEVTNFFADPLQWIYDKLDEFFERFW